MARKTVLISDLSGEPIGDGAGAQVRIQIESKPRSTFYLDASEEEVAELLAKATEKTKRGRPKK